MIAKLEEQFEKTKGRFANGSLISIFAKFEIEKIIEDVDYSLSLLKNLNNDDPMKQRYIALKNQLKEFNEFLAGYLVQDEYTF